MLHSISQECSKSLFISVTITLAIGIKGHEESNYSPNITRQLPSSFEWLLCYLSFDINIFIQAIPIFQEALKWAGYNHRLGYNNTKNCNQNILITGLILLTRVKKNNKNSNNKSYHHNNKGKTLSTRK